MVKFTRHSRTISDLEAGDYWLAVRSSTGVVTEESKVIRFTVEPQHGAGSMGQLQVDGTITSTYSAGSTTYLAGSFSGLGIRTGAGVIVNTKDDDTSGDVMAGTPQIDGAVHVSVPDGQGGWYIGGDFTKVGGYDMRGVAHLLPDGGVDPAFNPGTGVGPGGSVRALDIDAVNFRPARLYIGGGFSEYNGSPQNNIVAVNGATGARDTSFVTTSGRNTGTNAPVLAIKVDTRPHEPGNEKADYSGVYIAGAFSYVRGMAMSRVAKLELNGDRSRYSKTIPIDDSPEWAVIKAVIGSNAFTQTGWFESCGYGNVASPSYRCALMADYAFKPNPVDDLDQAYNKERAYAATVNVGPIVTKIDASVLGNAITSLDTYEQFRCITGMPMYPKPNGFLADIPLIGWLVTLANAASAATDKNSPANRYMSDFMYDKVVRSYDQTLIFGGTFEGSGQTMLGGFDAAAGTQDLTASNPSMTTLESFFPDLGRRLRADMVRSSTRLANSGVSGKIHDIEVSDSGNCDRNYAYLGGDFSFATTKGVRGGDIARIKLERHYEADWKVDPSWYSVETAEQGADGKGVKVISLDKRSNPTLITGAGAFASRASNGQLVDREGIVMIDPRTGGYDATRSENMRDGADGRVLTVSDLGGRAFVGGDFSAYDSWRRAGFAAIRPVGGAAGRVSIDKRFAPSAAITGATPSIATMTRASGVLFVGGSFDAAGNEARGSLVGYDAVTGGRAAIFGPGGGVDGEVRTIAATGDKLIVGGSFTRYDAHGSSGARIAGCSCRNLVVLNATTGMPYGIAADGTGTYAFADVDVDGRVNAIAVDGDVAFVGGAFDAVGNERGFGGLVGVNLRTAGLDEAFHATPGGTNGEVHVLATHEGALFVGGSFSELRGASANNIGKLSITDGAPDERFHADDSATRGPNGVVANIVPFGDLVIVAGEFTSYDGVTRPGLAAASGDTGHIIEAFAPTTGAGAIAVVGDRLLIGGADGGVTTVQVGAPDVTAPSFSPGTDGAIAPATLSGITHVAGGAFVRGGAAATPVTVTIVAGERFTFDDTTTGRVAGLANASFDLMRGDERVASDARRAGGAPVTVTCSYESRAPVTLLASKVGWAASEQPAELAGLGSNVTCTWDALLSIPTNATADLQLVTSDPAMRVVADGPLHAGSIVPVRITWADMPRATAGPQLRWKDTAAGFGPGAREIPPAAYGRAYSWTVPVSDLADGAYEVAGEVADAMGRTSARAMLGGFVVDATPPRPSSVTRTSPSAAWLTGGFSILVDAEPDDGSGIATRVLQRRTVPFTTGGEDLCDVAAPTTWVTQHDLGAAAAGATSIEIEQPSEGCHLFRLVSRDRLGHERTDAIELGDGVSPWTIVDHDAPQLAADAIESPLEGISALLGGDFTDTGAGINSFSVDITGAERWPLCPETRATQSRWACEFDTTRADDGFYDLAVDGRDRLGRSAEQLVVRGVHIDNVGPTVTATAAAADAASADVVAHRNGIVYFNASRAGGIRIDAASIDDGSGSELLMPHPAGWTIAADEALDEPDVAAMRRSASRFTSKNEHPTTRGHVVLRWPVGASSPGTLSVVGQETAGKQSTRTLTLVADVDAPVGAALGVTHGADDATDLRVTIGTDDRELADGSIEYGAGIAAAVVERQTTSLVGPDTCASEWTAWTSIATTQNDTALVDSDVVDKTCYRYRIAVTDAVGNTAINSAQQRVVGFIAPAAADPVEPRPEAPQPQVQVQDPAPVPPTTIRETPPSNDPPRRSEPREQVADQPGEDRAQVAPEHDERGTTVAGDPGDVQPAHETATQPVTPQSDERDVVDTAPAASTPLKAPRVTKPDDGWMSCMGGWVKDHPLGVALGAALGAHVGGTLLFGKGLGALLAKLHGMVGGHQSVPARVVKETMRRFQNVWRRRRRENVFPEAPEVDDAAWDELLGNDHRAA